MGEKNEEKVHSMLTKVNFQGHRNLQKYKSRNKVISFKVCFVNYTHLVT